MSTPQPKPDMPEKIYLQIEDDRGPIPVETGHVTWCHERVNDSDVEYIRADAAESKHAEEMDVARWDNAFLVDRLHALESRHAEEMREAIDLIRHVNEYWNGLDNPRALGDALTHIVEATDSFLSRHDKQSHSGTENVPSGDRKDKT